MQYLFSSILILLFALDKTRGRQDETKPDARRIVQQILKDTNVINLPPNMIGMAMSYYQKIFFDEIESDTFSALQSGLQPNVSLRCLNSLKDLVNGLREMRLWAIRMVDSFGKIPSGIFGGTLAAFGDYDLCVDTIVPGKFQGRYCRVAISLNGPIGTPPPLTPYHVNFIYNTDITETLMSFGPISKDKIPIQSSMCVPSTCTKNELARVLSKVNRGPAAVLDFHVKECIIKKELKFTINERILLTGIIALILFELAATILDFRLRALYPGEVYESPISTPVKCFLCFSFYTNAVRLFKKDDNPDSVKIFHGIKFLSMMWIMLGHTLLFNLKAVGRLIYGVKLSGEFFFQIVVNPYAAVETFFFMSGFLVMYSFIRKNIPRINFFLYALYRHLRLAPPIAFLICCVLLMDNIGYGPMWKEYITDYLIGTCATTWWKNLLCVNNLSRARNDCLPWTWYIAVDMQLYLATYFLLLLYRKNPTKTLWIIKILTFAGVIILVVNHVYYNLAPTPTMNYIRYPDTNYYSTRSHFRTYNHIVPYCFGLITGHLVGTRKKINIPSSMKVIGWITSTLFGMAVVFATYLWNSGRLPTLLESTLYGSLYRPLWSLMLMWIVYVCMNGDGGFVTTILSWEGFVLLGRLTYMVYLLHPLIQILALGQVKHIFYTDRKLLVITFIAFSVTSYSCAIVFCLICESPFMGLLSLLISTKVGKNGTLKKTEKKEAFSV